MILSGVDPGVLGRVSYIYIKGVRVGLLIFSFFLKYPMKMK